MITQVRPAEAVSFCRVGQIAIAMQTHQRFRYAEMVGRRGLPARLTHPTLKNSQPGLLGFQIRLTRVSLGGPISSPALLAGIVHPALSRQNCRKTPGNMTF